MASLFFIKERLANKQNMMYNIICNKNEIGKQ